MEQVLDLTNEHLHSLEGVAIHPSLTVLDLTANRLTSIDPRILALTGGCARAHAVRAHARAA